MILNIGHKGKAVVGPAGLWSVSFSELDHLIQNAVLKLETMKTTSNMMFSLKMSPDLHCIVYLMAALRSQRPVAIFSSDWTPSELTRYQSVLGTSISLDLTNFGEVFGHQDIVYNPQTALVIFTSGSTGVPKAVQVSRENILSNTDAIVESLRFSNVSKQHLFLNLSYSFGLLGQLLPALQQGVTTYLYKSVLDLKSVLSCGTLEGMVSGVPSHLKLLATLADVPNGSVTDVVSAGSFLDFEIRQKLKEKFPNARLSSNYGQTEASPRILSYGSEDENFYITGVGRPVKGIQFRISEESELLVKGPQMMLGYLGDLESTRIRIQNGWLMTGDLASADSSGLISIHGRRDDQIKIAGERLSPQEIESVLVRILGVAECLIFVEVLPHGEGILGLVLEDGTALPSSTDIRKLISENLSKQKIPKVIYVAPQLPKNKNGKIVRKNLDNEIKKWRKL